MTLKGVSSFFLQSGRSLWQRFCSEIYVEYCNNVCGSVWKLITMSLTLIALFVKILITKFTCCNHFGFLSKRMIMVVLNNCIRVIKVYSLFLSYNVSILWIMITQIDLLDRFTNCIRLIYYSFDNKVFKIRTELMLFKMRDQTS